MTRPGTIALSAIWCVLLFINGLMESGRVWFAAATVFVGGVFVIVLASLLSALRTYWRNSC